MTDYYAFIAGKKVTADKKLPVVNPATEELLGTFPECTQAQLEEAVSSARKAFVLWSETDGEVRVKALHRMADLIEANAGELARLLTLEQGKPLKGRGSEFEVQGCVTWLRATAGMSLPVKILEDSDQRQAFLYRKPVGVVASITPWNWPLLIAVWHLAPAIRVGCTVVVKPASNTPLSTLRMVEIFNEALPAGVLNVVTGDVGRKLPGHPGIDKVVFTGSTPVGRKVMREAAAGLKRLTLELGGNDAGIMLPDTNINRVIEGVFWGAFINGGQTCGALKRLYVHESQYEEVCRALTEIATGMPMGDGLDDNNLFGPVQNQVQFNYVRELVDEARERGARVLCGGEARDGKGFFYPLTLLADVTDEMRIVKEEQFGPALPIIKYSEVDEAVARANDSEMGLGGSVWSGNIEQAKIVASRLECGTVWINSHGSVAPHVPFGGVKSSGIGVEFGIEGLEEYTVIQSMHVPQH
ncbi:aldehyde dehydrogenase family protein [Kineobactrum salinum]|uniref:Aldehyde dehydrogenase family protein n=1 Tax=Kineobactrum salinum TaxID=2708301 RepID=A0A6C0U3M8_9GAMM|nr:aldehyde dehydrogenase family protein [Kineobactrum salinum]QIB64965.1 aldehyde dehydrogenase family protein [Kineobactrum salinum]